MYCSNYADAIVDLRFDKKIQDYRSGCIGLGVGRAITLVMLLPTARPMQPPGRHYNTKEFFPSCKLYRFPFHIKNPEMVAGNSIKQFHLPPAVWL
jgi:hypothetical protein